MPQEQQTEAGHELVEVDPQRLQFEKQRLQQATADKGFSLKYSVPWDIWCVACNVGARSWNHVLTAAREPTVHTQFPMR